VALAEALRGAPWTLLKELNLKKVGMCDEGMVALASAVHQGSLERLKELDLYKDKGVTGDGVLAVAGAINERGLPQLERFSMGGCNEPEHLSPRGVGAIASALVKGCPRMTYTHAECDSGYPYVVENMIEGMFEGVKREVIVSAEYKFQRRLQRTSLGKKEEDMIES